MSYSIATGNRFSAFIEEPEQPKQPQKKAESKPKAPSQPAGKKADNQPAKKKQQQKQQPQKSKPKSPDFGGPITDDGFTPVTDKRERRKPKPAPKRNVGQTRKRTYDRHVSGTGRGKEIKRKGHGKANWGDVVEAGVEDAREQINRPRRNKNKVNKPKRPKKPVEKKKEEEEAPKELTEEEKKLEEQRRKEEEEEKKKLTLDQYLKRQKAQQVKMKKNRSRRPGEGQGDVQPEGFKPISKPSEEQVTVVQLKNKKETGSKANPKKKKETRLDVNEFLKDAPKTSKPRGKGPGKKNTGKPRRGRKAPAPQSQPNLEDEESFPSLG